MAEQDPTRDRLLHAAGEEFAEKGFGAARVRSICRKAGANVASVNYYFGDKEQLYIQAVLEAHRCGMSPLPEAPGGGDSAEEELRTFVHQFLANVLAMQEEDSWPKALMLREMLQPSAACEAVVREAIRPRFEHLSGIFDRLAPGVDDRRRHALVFSVIGQCLFYKTARPVSERLVGPEALRALDLDFLTDHITAFTLAGLGRFRPAGLEGEPEAVGPRPWPHQP